MEASRWLLKVGDSPLMATAVHNGHDMRPELLGITALSEAERFREEDPFTDFLAEIVPTRLVSKVSRFEVDLNRARNEAVYCKPEDAWGLNLWKIPLTPEMIQASLDLYDAFYRELHGLLIRLEKKFGGFILLDIHSYNHRRSGPDQSPEDPEKNPEINLGTGTMDRRYWAPLVDRFLAEIKKFDFDGRALDIRENIKFRGRQIPTYVHSHFPKSGCALALEFKKIFMDEWTGKPDKSIMKKLREALRSTLPGLLEELKKR